MSSRYSKLVNISFILVLVLLVMMGIFGFLGTKRLIATYSETSQSERALSRSHFPQAVNGASFVLLALSFYFLRREIKQREAAEQTILRLNEELEARRLQLDAANKELEIFSYSISHDLRAPIRHIGGFVDLLKKHPAISQDAKGSRHLDFINNAVQQMGALVDGLTSFSRLSHAEMRREPVQLGNLVQEIKESLADSCAGRSILWSVDEKLPQVQADSFMLRSALVCLLSNSIKFTRSRSEALIEIQYSSTPGEHVVSIKDNGVGFNMEYADKLFGVFQKFHHSDEFEGTGVGLATVRRIISRHGGRTWAESKVDQGATFSFSLPKNPVQTSFHNG